MEEELKKTLAVLHKGGTILYPTDTVWGLGCDARNKEAVAKNIRAMKYNGVLGETTFDSNGQTKVAVAIAQYVVKGGKWERM